MNRIIQFRRYSTIYLIPSHLPWCNSPTGPGPPQYRCFTITFRHTTLGKTPLDELSARRRDLYLTKHNTHKRQTSMSPAGFEPAIPTSKQPHVHALRPRGQWDLPQTSISTNTRTSKGRSLSVLLVLTRIKYVPYK